MRLLIVLITTIIFSSTQILADPKFERVSIGLVQADDTVLYFNTELALTEEQQSLGLMHREKMSDMEGMLFIFEEVRFRTFWMKNTKIALDILFFDKDGKVVSIKEWAIPYSEDLINSQGFTKYVLEINAGLVEKLGISHETKLILPNYLGLFYGRTSKASFR